MPTDLSLAIASFGEQALADLSANAAAVASRVTGRVGVAVTLPERGTVYSVNGGATFAMASTVKVPIMLTVMAKSLAEGRELTAQEQAALEKMITVSDNDAATTLWNEVGRGAGVGAFLQDNGLGMFAPDRGESWGDSETPAGGMARLLAMLAAGAFLDPSRCTLALDLMGHVALGQRWGVSAGLPAGRLVGLKNGWYPLDTGWRVNSTGIVQPPTGPAYALAIMSDGQPSFNAGIHAVEQIAVALHHDLLGDPGPAPGDTYTVQTGDTLSAIAQQLYGDAGQWQRLYDANRDQISDPNVIVPGQVLRVP